MDEQTLTAALTTRGGIAPDSAGRVARKIASFGGEVLASALAWAGSGILPAGPVVQGYSPAALGRCMNVAQAYTALIALTRDPRRAQDTLWAHFPDLP